MLQFIHKYSIECYCKLLLNQNLHYFQWFTSLPSIYSTGQFNKRKLRSFVVSSMSDILMSEGLLS